MSHFDINIIDVNIKTVIVFTFKKMVVEHDDAGVGRSYLNDTVHQGVVRDIVHDHVANGNKVDAVKTLREDNPGLSPKDAIAVADAMIAQYLLTHPKVVLGGWEYDVCLKFRDVLAREMGSGRVVFPPADLLKPDRKIEYIKQLRTDNNIGLKLAKDISDEVWRLAAIR